MRIFKKILTTMLAIVIALFAFTSCGKAMTADKAEKEMTKVQDVINKGFDYVELVETKYDDVGEIVSKETFYYHKADDKFYYALYNYVDEIENEGEASEAVKKKEILIQRMWEYKDEEIYKIISEELTEAAAFDETVKDAQYEFNRQEITVEEYNADFAKYLDYMFEGLFPESKDEYKVEELVKGTLTDTIVFNPANKEEISQIELSVNNTTHKIHKALTYFEDGSYSQKIFNYPMIKGLVKKTEIPEIK